jgi:hypothetical protein
MSIEREQNIADTVRERVKELNAALRLAADYSLSVEFVGVVKDGIDTRGLRNYYIMLDKVKITKEI